MKAIHINWSAPSSRDIEDFELLTTILSAMNWRKYNGTITLVADEKALDIYNKLKITKIWNDIEHLKVNETIDPTMFWAAGKIFALKNQTAPVIMMDTDFIVWQKIDFPDCDCAVIHFEDLYEDIYPNTEFFKMSDNYKWDNYNWNVKASNTAFAFFNNQKLLDYYTDKSIEFMENSQQCGDFLRYMVFCEQRLLSMCCDKLNMSLNAFSSQEELFSEGNKTFTHTWGMKQQMRDNDGLRYDFCRRCIDRISTDFPELTDTLKNIDILKRYF